jgi:hypothetical protein
LLSKWDTAVTLCERDDRRGGSGRRYRDLSNRAVMILLFVGDFRSGATRSGQPVSAGSGNPLFSLV